MLFRSLPHRRHGRRPSSRGIGRPYIRRFSTCIYFCFCSQPATAGLMIRILSSIECFGITSASRTGWSPSLLRLHCPRGALRAWCLSAGHRVGRLLRSGLSSSASERNRSFTRFASRVTEVCAKDVGIRGVGARTLERPTSSWSVASGVPSPRISLPPDVLARTSSHYLHYLV